MGFISIILFPSLKSLIDAGELSKTEPMTGKKLIIPKKKKIKNKPIHALIILKKLPANKTHIF